MSPLDAKNIVESLVNGIDPDTGEVLPDQSPFNSPRVIRALFVASKALDNVAKREQKDRRLPDNAGKSWSDAEDKELLSGFDGGISVKDLSAKHCRTEGAIASRLVRLGRIKPRADAYAGA